MIPQNYFIETLGIGADKSASQYMKVLWTRYAESALADFHELRRDFNPPEQQKCTGTTMTYWRLHYHLIWATFERQPTLTLEREKVFYGVLYRKAEELEMKIHAAGNVDDHVHVVLSIPPKLAVADCVKHIKGASAFAINHMPNTVEKIKWQEGYGALSVGERSLEIVMAYAANQKQHHKERNLLSVYERIDEE